MGCNGTIALQGRVYRSHLPSAIWQVLGRLRSTYKRVRAKMYREHKRAVIADDNAKLARFQGGCPKLLNGASKAEIEASVKCLQARTCI